MKPTPHDLCLEAANCGLVLDADGDRLKVTPADRLTPEFADRLRQYKIELLSWLKAPPCPGWQAVPPSDLPLSPVQPRPTAENRERLIGHMRRQTGDRPGPLTAWLVKREDAYFDGPGRRWDCGLLSYAAARDAATWQLKCSEGQVWLTLEGFELAKKA